jgi:protein-L-isoaspartate(D-aspartate) O-methyltransferase
VARAAELMLEVCPEPKAARVLEIGTGCGYAAAVLAQVFGTVVSVERLRALHEQARANLRPLRIANLRLVFGDGALGCAAEAPFDAIVAAAAAEAVPPAWIEQLKPGGRIVAPLGAESQQMTVLDKDDAGRMRRRTLEAVRFVPLRGGVG